MTQQLLILGAGGHARVLIEALRQGGHVPAGLVDADPSLTGTRIMGIPVLGTDEAILGYPPEEVRLVNGLGSVASMARRKELYLGLFRRGYRFATVLHPFTAIASDVELGDGIQVMAGAVLQVGVRVGEDCIINTRASVDHDCIIGNHVHIAPGVTVSGGVCIEDDVHIGTGATLIQGVRIGRGSTIGAGAVVVRNVSPGATAYGVPAREVAR